MSTTPKTCKHCGREIDPAFVVALKGGTHAHMGCALQHSQQSEIIGKTAVEQAATPPPAFLARPRHEEDADAWVQTFTGRAVTPFALTPEQVCIEDIAHALAHQCRYTGSSRQFYSVAAHSLAVQQALANDGHPALVQFAGLIHDAGEAYLADVAAPLKAHPVFAMYRAEEKKVDAAVRDALGFTALLVADKYRETLEKQIWHTVKRYDLMMLECERHTLLGTPPKPWLLLPEPTRGVRGAFGWALSVQGSAEALGTLQDVGDYFKNRFELVQAQALRESKGQK